MPSKDRAEALKAVKKVEQRRRDGAGVVRDGSSSTTSNDWKHWVVMQGNEHVAVDDVRSVGEAIGVQLKGDTKNMFSVLARKGKPKQMSSGQTQGVGRETKLQSCDDSICSTLWGNSSHGFSYRPSVGASGGLLTLWDTAEVTVWSSESFENVLWCHGLFVRTGEEFYLANVYAPCDSRAKQVLWDSLSVKIQALGRSRVCICGDFNAVRSLDERRSANEGYRPSDHTPFNRFIDDNTLIDLPLCGRKYTWFKGDGRSMSRLDRFLLSGEWCLTWPNCTQVARMRGLSDHCPLVLVADEENWGPRPSRMLKCWKDVPGYHLFVREKWNSFQVDGWGGFVLKEKLKWIKTALKDWHSSHTQNLPSRIESLKDRLAVLDVKGGEEVLSESEL
ncbi:cysteine-rich receptor-like protein kinase, partial [Trifolium pratense]